MMPIDVASSNVILFQPRPLNDEDPLEAILSDCEARERAWGIAQANTSNVIPFRLREVPPSKTKPSRDAQLDKPEDANPVRMRPASEQLADARARLAELESPPRRSASEQLVAVRARLAELRAQLGEPAQLPVERVRSASEQLAEIRAQRAEIQARLASYDQNGAP